MYRQAGKSALEFGTQQTKRMLSSPTHQHPSHANAAANADDDNAHHHQHDIGSNGDGARTPPHAMARSHSGDPPPPALRTNRSLGGKELDCCVCLELSTRGICCNAADDEDSFSSSSSFRRRGGGVDNNNNNNNSSAKRISHHVCETCFAPYVKSICDDMGRLKDSNFSIRCPVPGCKSEPIASHDVTSALRGEHKSTLDLYIRVVIAAAAAAECSGGVGKRSSGGGSRNASMDSTTSSVTTINNEDDLVVPLGQMAHIVAEALSLHCPSAHCRAILDPSPDGCASLRCAACGVYFCWLCFAMMRSNNAAHDHVRVCRSSPRPGTLFFNQGQVAPAHRQLRIQSVRRALLEQFGDGWRKSKAVRQALQHTRALLQGSKISEQDVLAAEALPLAAPPAAMPNPLAGGLGVLRDAEPWLRACVLVLILAFTLPWLFGLAAALVGFRLVF